MRVLLLFPMADGQTGPAIKYAFEQLGHTVMAVDAKLKLGNSYITACHFRPDFVFCSRTKALTEQIKQIKQKLNPIICMWNVDGRKNIGKWKHLYELVKLCDLHFVTYYGSVKEWRELNKNTHWLPQGVQNEVYNKPKSITMEDRERYIADVAFAGGLKGSVHWQRKSFIDAIKRADIKFKHWTGIRNEQHNKMVALTKVNLGCTVYFGSGSGTSVRDYKIMGAGGFLLELWRERIHVHFPLVDSEKLMDTYKDSNDLIEKINYYLEHEEERKAIAERGYNWLHKNARYIDRMKIVIDYTGKIGGQENEQAN